MVSNKREAVSRKEKEASSEESEESSSSGSTETSSGSGSGSTEASESGSSSTSSSDSEEEKEKSVPKQKQGSSAAVVASSPGRKLVGKGKAGGKLSNNAAAPSPKKPKRRRRRPRQLTICLTNCRYEIVRSVAKRYSLVEVGEDESWNIYWTDFSVSLERAMDMRRYQLVNHFPGMNEICRKDLLSRNLNRMKRLFCAEYDIFPKTWSLPADLGDLQTYAHTRKNKTYICKPEMGCQGRGIFLIRNIKDLNPFGKIICQQYISKPFLIDNFKFDLRIYVLLTTCDPLRIYVFNEGLARFATAKYKLPTNNNTENSYMHLTNYAVNKYSRDYVVDDEGGSKRKLSAVYRWLEQRSYDTQELIANIDDVIIKTIVSAHPILKHNYRTCFPHHDLCSACFEILGFDILLDYKLKPYVLEVNHSPSFHTDAKLDKEIKESLLNDTFAMLNMKQLDRYKVESDDRRRVQDRLLNKSSDKGKDKKETELIDGMSQADHQFQWELEHCGGYRLVYPSPTADKYDKYFEQNLSSLYHETASSQARANCTRSQMEEYNKMKQIEEKKRLSMGLSQTLLDRPKEKSLRPESPTDPEKPKIKKKVLQKSKEIGGFVPGPIVADEELDRMKSLMQRGMLIRSLGIELQVFKLLCQIGNLKPEEEKIFRRMHGFSATPGTLKSREIYQRSGDRNELLEQLQKGEPQHSQYQLSSEGPSGNKPDSNATARGDFHYPTMSSTLESPHNTFKAQSDSSPRFPQTATNNAATTNNNPHPVRFIASTSIKNPYSVPYNSPAPFGSYQSRPKSTSYNHQQHQGTTTSTVTNITNFIDRVNPSSCNMTMEDEKYYQQQQQSYPPGTTGGYYYSSSSGYGRNPATAAAVTAHEVGGRAGNANGALVPSSLLAQDAASNRYPRYPNNNPQQGFQASSARTVGRQQTSTRVSPSPGNGLDSIQNVNGRISWPPPPLASQTNQYPNDQSKLRSSPILATKNFRSHPAEAQPESWTTRHNLSRVQGTSSVTNSGTAAGNNVFIRRPKPISTSGGREDADPVQCTQMFLNNNNSVPVTAQAGGGTTTTTTSGSGRTDTRKGMTNLSFLRGVGNVALLRAAGRLNPAPPAGNNAKPPSAVLPLPVSKVHQQNSSLNYKGISVGQDGSPYK